jgi:hypothetical protein
MASGLVKAINNKKITFVVMSVGWYNILKWAAPVANKVLIGLVDEGPPETSEEWEETKKELAAFKDFIVDAKSGKPAEFHFGKQGVMRFTPIGEDGPQPIRRIPIDTRPTIVEEALVEKDDVIPADVIADPRPEDMA